MPFKETSRARNVEPYPKSKAFALHSDSIALDDPKAIGRVRFVPFAGIAARRFFDLFSMRLSAGLEMKRKQPDGTVIKWDRARATPRVRMAPYSYLERELIAMSQLGPAVERMEQRAKSGGKATTRGQEPGGDHETH